jgi:hypothetical protein
MPVCELRFGLSNARVVIGIMMPISDGTEFIQQLRDEPATVAVPVLASSAGRHFACSPDTVAFKPCGEHVLAIAHPLLAIPGVTGGSPAGQATGWISRDGGWPDDRKRSGSSRSLSGDR